MQEDWMGGPCCLNVGSRFDYVAQLGMRSTLGRKGKASAGSANLDHPVNGPKYDAKLDPAAVAPYPSQLALGS